MKIEKLPLKQDVETKAVLAIDHRKMLSDIMKK